MLCSLVYRAIAQQAKAKGQRRFRLHASCSSMQAQLPNWQESTQIAAYPQLSHNNIVCPVVAALRLLLPIPHRKSQCVARCRFPSLTVYDDCSLHVFTVSLES
jgi:hypothetical protein